MSREFVLVPKLKYENMMKSLEEKDSEKKLKDDSKVEQKGGKIHDSQLKPLLNINNEDAGEQSQSQNSNPPKQSPSKLYVKRSLSDMKSVFHQPVKKRKNTIKKAKWVNYTIS